MQGLRKRVREYRRKIIAWMPSVLIFMTMVFIGCASYAFGMLSGAELKRAPIVIEQYPQIDEENFALLCEHARSTIKVTSSETQEESTIQTSADHCAFVGSINGTKYYPPGCSLVERIKPVNLRCFSSGEDAETQGYERTSACKG